MARTRPVQSVLRLILRTGCGAVAGYSPKTQQIVLPAGKWLSMAALLEAMYTLCCSGVSTVMISMSREKILLCLGFQ